MSNVTLDTWKPFEERLEGITAANFASSESVLVLTSPVLEYGQDALDAATAVGLIQSINMQQQRTVSQLFEVGSRFKYTFSSGRVRGNLGLSRVIFDGESLLRAVRKEESLSLVGDTGLALSGSPDLDVAGYGGFYINLAASLFSRPVSIMFIFRDLGGENIGGCFFREAYVTSHGMNISSNQPFIQENCQIMYESVLPLMVAPGSRVAQDIVLPNNIA
mgnify:CR=1 FL=1